MREVRAEFARSLSSNGLDVLVGESKQRKISLVSRTRLRESRNETHPIPNPVVGDETEEGRDGLGSDESGREAAKRRKKSVSEEREGAEREKAGDATYTTPFSVLESAAGRRKEKSEKLAGTSKREKRDEERRHEPEVAASEEKSPGRQVSTNHLQA